MLSKKDGVFVYHKTSCITCKKTITEIERMNTDVGKRDFFKDPFSEVEFKKIIKMTGKKPSELLRKRDKMYKELDLENSKKTDEQLIKLMVKFPGLILRPIIIIKNKAHVGKVDVKNLK
jgi:arsenate reductase